MGRRKPPASAAVSTAPYQKLERNLDLLTEYDRDILAYAEKNGGIWNAHAHLDRSYTINDMFLRHIGTTPLEASHLPLSVKQHLVGDLHNGIAYTEANLRERLEYALDRQIAFGVTRVDTNIDATPDLPEGGLLAIRVALEVAAKYKGRGIEMRIAPTPIFGFKPDTRHKRTRWEVFAEAAAMCHYLSLLPEKDDFPRKTDPDGKVGFKSHVRMGLELAGKFNKEVQFHVDQANIPNERGTERVLDVIEVVGQPKLDSGPSVTVIHMISPSADSEPQYARLVDRLLEFNVRVCVAPTAAVSMRQLRSIEAPIHNSIARVPELIKSRIPLCLGTDNIADVFVPQGDGDMLSEIRVGALATRLNSPSIWAKLATGTPLNNVDINRVGRGLHEERKACIAVGPPGWRPAVE